MKQLRICHIFSFFAIFLSSVIIPSFALAKTEDPLQLATKLSKLERWADALPLFQEASSQNPQDGQILANLGVAFSHVDKHKEALLSYDKALTLGYDNANFRYFRGISFARLNLLGEAAKEMETALEMDPLMPTTLYDLGRVYKMQGKTEAALSLVKKLYPRNPTLSKKLFDQIPSPYKIAHVENGGTLTGKVLLKGDQPKARAFNLVFAPNIEFCSRISDGQGHRILHDFATGPQGGLQDTVIALIDVKKGKEFPKDMKAFNIKRCHTENYVIGVKNGEDILIENTDPIRHEIVTYQIYQGKVKQTSNKPVSAKTSQVRNAFIKPGSEEFIMKCNLHPFLQTRGVVIANPYFAISDKTGHFSIDGIPPGTYQVMAWHPFIPSQFGTITIHANEETSLNFAYQSKDIRRKLYQDDTKGYRFNTWFDSKEKFYGGKRIDDKVEVLQHFDNSKRYESESSLTTTEVN